MARTTNIPAFKLYISTSKRPPSLIQFILYQLVLECTTRGYKYIYIYIYTDPGNLGDGWHLLLLELGF